MVRVSYNQKPLRRTLIRIWGGEVFPSPSTQTEAGRKILEEDPNVPARWESPSPRPSKKPRGSPEANYSLGSVLNHVLLHQTVIGQEAKEQLSPGGRPA